MVDDAAPVDSSGDVVDIEFSFPVIQSLHLFRVKGTKVANELPTGAL